MAIAFPSFQVASSAADTNSVRSTFLTPPLSPLDSHDTPFRPAPNDHTSLNMKKRHHKHIASPPSTGLSPKRKPRALERSGSDVPPSNGHGVGTDKNLPRCKSLKEIYRHGSGSVSPTSMNPRSKISSNGKACEGRERRWTLPSKSEATRGFTALKSTVKQATYNQDTESPAIITLRRATNNPYTRKSEITFFPEPTFSHEQNGLLSYLISTFSRAGTFNNTTTNVFGNENRTSRSTSVDSRAALGTVTVPAATVYTETTVDANLTMPGTIATTSTKRRCSTKYTSGSTVYEIIWDGSDSVSNGTQSSRQSFGGHRRSSLAVLTLEAQLAKSNESSRRQSKASTMSSRKASMRSVDMFPEQALTISKLEVILPRLLHKTGLRDLPKSRSRRQRKSTICSTTVEEADPRTLSGGGSEVHNPSVSGIEFFPPLASRRNSDAPAKDWTSGAGVKVTDATSYASSPHSRPPYGSMIGSSNHTRRRSSAYITTTMGVFRQPFKRVGSNKGERSDDDRLPLLG